MAKLMATDSLLTRDKVLLGTDLRFYFNHHFMHLLHAAYKSVVVLCNCMGNVRILPA